eukprot:GHVS01036947.1.p1 GENE.GHVS01036947.1~~GHVS01036947.1.p1  ORF type:complete len:176 (+),score=27.72 GHVS01036947.1:160-687(+)
MVSLCHLCLYHPCVLSDVVTAVGAWKVTIERAVAENIHSLLNLHFLVPSSICSYDDTNSLYDDSCMYSDTNCMYSDTNCMYSDTNCMYANTYDGHCGDKLTAMNSKDNVIDDILLSHYQSSTFCEDDDMTQPPSSPSKDTPEFFEQQLEALTCLLDEIKPFEKLSSRQSTDTSCD